MKELLENYDELFRDGKIGSITIYRKKEDGKSWITNKNPFDKGEDIANYIQKNYGKGDYIICINLSGERGKREYLYFNCEEIFEDSNISLNGLGSSSDPLILELKRQNDLLKAQIEQVNKPNTQEGFFQGFGMAKDIMKEMTESLAKMNQKPQIEGELGVFLKGIEQAQKWNIGTETKEDNQPDANMQMLGQLIQMFFMNNQKQPSQPQNNYQTADQNMTKEKAEQIMISKFKPLINDIRRMKAENKNNIEVAEYVKNTYPDMINLLLSTGKENSIKTIQMMRPMLGLSTEEVEYFKEAIKVI